MGTEVAVGAGSGVLQQSPLIEILEKPIIDVQADVVFRTYALRHDPEEKTVQAMGFVTTKPSRLRWLCEFTGYPTGEYSPCTAVKGFVGEGEVYSKAVRKDLPLSGLRTVIAQRRASRAIIRHLK